MGMTAIIGFLFTSASFAVNSHCYGTPDAENFVFAVADAEIYRIAVTTALKIATKTLLVNISTNTAFCGTVLVVDIRFFHNTYGESSKHPFTSWPLHGVLSKT